MKQVFTINISGQFFRIDSEAYAKLQLFLSNYKASIENKEQKEILTQQMEYNLANELRKLCENTECIIDIQTTNIAIENIDNNKTSTNEFDNKDNNNSTTNQNNSTYTKASTYNNNKRLFRNEHSRVLGGVCSGLANYFNIDKALVRLLFIVLFFITAGFALLLYIILWIAAPLSSTNSNMHQRNEKDGQRNGRRYDHHQFEKDKIPRSDNVLAKIFGLLLMLFGFLILSALITATVFGTRILGFVPAFSDGLIINHIVGDSFGPSMVFALFLITAIPVFLLIYAGTKLLFNYIANSRKVFLTALTTWIIAIIIAIGLISGIVNDFKTNNSISEQQILSNNSDTLFIKINENTHNNINNIKFEVNKYKIAITDNNEIIIARPSLNIKKSADEQTTINYKKTARGSNYKRASYEAESIIHHFNIIGDTLLIDPYFTLANEHKWREQSVELALKVPTGKILYLDHNLLPILHNAKNEQNIWEPDMTGLYWKMGEDKLSINHQ